MIFTASFEGSSVDANGIVKAPEIPIKTVHHTSDDMSLRGHKMGKMREIDVTCAVSFTQSCLLTSNGKIRRN